MRPPTNRGENSPWYEVRPDALTKLRIDLRRRYPHLHLSVANGVVSANGTVAIGAKGRELSRFRVQIVLANDHPASLPQVFETARRIPRVSGLPGSHVNPDGSLCIGLPEALRLQYRDLDLLDFLDGPLRAYLLGIFEVENGRPWPFGEWSHGDKGLREFYRDQLAINDPSAIRALLTFAQRPQLSWLVLCPCGSGKTIASCHASVLRRLKSRLSKSTLAAAIAAFAKEED